MFHCHLKSVAIANEVIFLGTIVVPKHPLIQVAEQLERLDGDGSFMSDEPTGITDGSKFCYLFEVESTVGI